MNQEARNEFQNAKVNVAGGICIPSFVTQRAALAIDGTNANATAFGGTVGTVDNGISEMFKPADIGAQLGARNLEGLTGDVVFQVQNAVATATNDTEEGAPNTIANPGFTSRTLQPTRYSAHTQVTDQMLAQSADDMGAFLAKEIRDAMAKKFNADIIAKVKAAAITNGPSGTALHTYVAASENTLDLESYLLGNDVPLEGVKALSSASAYRALRALSHDAGSGMLFATSPLTNRSVMGYETFVSSQVSAGEFFMMNINELVTGTWGGLNLIIDPYTDADHGVTRIIANSYRDVEYLQSKAFEGLTGVA